MGTPWGPDGLPPHGVPPNTHPRLPNKPTQKSTTPNRVPQFTSYPENQTLRDPETQTPRDTETDRQTETPEKHTPLFKLILD